MFWKIVHVIIGLLGMILFSFLGGSSEFKALGITFLMVYWWVSQPVPIYITALTPLIFGPMSGLLTETDLALSYGNKMVFLFLGGFILAMGIEKWRLHSAFAESLISIFGNTPKRILLGFMVSTAFLSMWISNTATALMMLPMAMAVINSIPRFRLKKRFSIALLLSVAFAANIGGTATLIGTPPNIQMAAILETQFNIEISFLSWAIFAFPFMLTLLLFTYFTLSLLFLKHIDFTLHVFERQRLTPNQLKVLFIFLLAVLLWVTRTWVNQLLGVELNDMMIAIIAALLFFIVPQKEKGKTLITWSDMKRIPWGILFLFGGGLALASILSNSGVLNFFLDFLLGLSGVGFLGVLIIICVFTIFTTELMSNLALVSLLLPVMGQFALDASFPVLAVCSGIALCASCAFMLPVATPPNAIIFASNKVNIKTMVRVGLFLNLLTVVLVVTLIYIWY